MNKRYIDQHEAYMLIAHEAEMHELPASKEAYERAALIVDQMRPVAEPRTGHWRKIAKTLYASEVASITADYECSVCGRVVFNISDGWAYKIYLYCPNCGARMETTG